MDTVANETVRNKKTPEHTVLHFLSANPFVCLDWKSCAVVWKQGNAGDNSFQSTASFIGGLEGILNHCVVRPKLARREGHTREEWLVNTSFDLADKQHGYNTVQTASTSMFCHSIRERFTTNLTKNKAGWREALDPCSIERPPMPITSQQQQTRAHLFSNGHWASVCSTLSNTQQFCLWTASESRRKKLHNLSGWHERCTLDQGGRTPRVPNRWVAASCEKTRGRGAQVVQ